MRLSNSHLAAALNAVEPGFRRLLIRSLGDPHHHPTLASKQAQQHFVETQGIPTPRDRQVHTIEDALAYAREVGMPVVVKQDFNSGGKGVWFCYGEDDLYEAFRTVFQSGGARANWRERLKR